jgi:hypothetical protein
LAAQAGPLTAPPAGQERHPTPMPRHHSVGPTHCPTSRVGSHAAPAADATQAGQQGSIARWEKTAGEEAACILDVEHLTQMRECESNVKLRLA